MLVTNCIECGKAFKRLSLKSTVKYCNECRVPRRNRYQQKANRFEGQARDAHALLEEHTKRLDAVELTQEVQLSEIDTIANDVAAKAAALVAKEVDRVLAERGLEGDNVKKVMKSLATVNSRLILLEKKMEETPKLGVRKDTIKKMKEELSNLKGMMKKLDKEVKAIPIIEKPKMTRAQTNRHGRVGKVIRFLHRVEVATLNTIMSEPLKDVSQVTVYNNLKWAEKKGYVKKHKMGQKTAYTIGSIHWSEHYRRKAEKGKAEEEE